MFPYSVIHQIFLDLLSPYFLYHNTIDKDKYLFEIQIKRKLPTLSNIAKESFDVPEVFIDMWEELNNPFNYIPRKESESLFPSTILNKIPSVYLTGDVISAKVKLYLNPILLERFFKLIYFYEIKNL